MVNITSYFKGEQVASASEYVCGAGFLMTAVGLRGFWSRPLGAARRLRGARFCLRFISAG